MLYTLCQEGRMDYLKDVLVWLVVGWVVLSSLLKAGETIERAVLLYESAELGCQTV